MDIVTLGAALNGSAEYVNSHFKGGSNIQIVDNPDGTQTINASGEVSSEDTVARADIAAIKDGETLDSFGDVETALDDKADKSTTYTKTEVDTSLGSKQNTISDLSTIRSGAALGATAVQPETGKGLSTNDYTTAEKTKLAGVAEGAEVNEIEGIKVNNTTINPDANKVVNITVPTTAADVSALPDATKYAAALSLTINSSTYVMTGQLKDQNGDNLGTAQTIDLPLESVVVGGSYNSQTKKVVLTLQNGNTIEFSVADLVSGLQTELSASNKLNPAYINYDSAHRAVSDTEKSTWNGKQNALTTAQLDAVNSGIDSEKVAQTETNKNNISTLEHMNGAKNKFNYEAWKNCGVYNGTKTINDNSFTIVASGDDCFTFYENIASRQYPIDARISCNAEDKVVFTWDYTPLSSQTDDRVGIFANGSTSSGFFALVSANDKKLEFTAPTGTTYLSIRFGVRTLGNSATYGNIQIQSKASYDAGFTDYQPYAMSNAELTAAIHALQAQLANQ